MLQRIAIVNRGEAAMRLIHAVRDINAQAGRRGHRIETVALHTEGERSAMFVRESDGRSLATVVNQRLGLTGSTAETVLVLLTTPEPSAATATASGLSLALLVFSLNSVTRTLRRSMERPWVLPRVGWRSQSPGWRGWACSS